MPIVLAIEPDRRQAAHLSAIVRHQVGADLVLADTTEGALDAIGDRVPDLVLVPALLSPQDDAALAAALRVIAAAAHVRTLTIPVLAHGTTPAASGGLLAKWRKRSAASPEPDGCEPAVFGEQITAYLKEAAAERAQIEDDRLDDEPVQAPAPPTLHSDPELRPQAPTFNGDLEPEPVLQPLQLWASDPIEETAIEPDETVVDLSDELEGLSEDETDGEFFDRERVGVYTISADADAPDVDAFDLLPAILEPAVATEPARLMAEPLVVEPPLVDPAVAEIGFAEPVFAEPVFGEPVFVEAMLVEAMFVEPAAAPRADIAPWVPMFLTPGRMWPALEGVPAEMPVARTEQPDWIELVASLRQDLERRRTDPASAAPDPIAARPSDGAHAAAHRLVKKPRAQAKKAKPVQDEWGFFDPEQCGFSTLLAKLDEITDGAGG